MSPSWSTAATARSPQPVARQITFTGRPATIVGGRVRVTAGPFTKAQTVPPCDVALISKPLLASVMGEGGRQCEVSGAADPVADVSAARPSAGRDQNGPRSNAVDEPQSKAAATQSSSTRPTMPRPRPRWRASSKTAGFDPVRPGGLAASVRIEVSRDLHAAGGLNGRLLHKEAASLLIPPKRAVS